MSTPKRFAVGFLLCVCVSASSVNGFCQTNSWTKPSSGSWDEPFWSVGMLPGTNQNILLTNAGWKAVAIGSSTVANHPESLTIDSLLISSPTDSFNELLMNCAGLESPLRIQGPTASFVVASNSAVVLLDSALEVASYIGTGTHGQFSIGGTFSQGESSSVTAGFMRVGDIGPGVYDMTNGTVNIGVQYIGGAFPGAFIQRDGVNSGSIQIDNGQYDLYAGEVPGAIINVVSGDFNQHDGVVTALVQLQAGTFTQSGGVLNGAINMTRIDMTHTGSGTYRLLGGIHTGDMSVPNSDQQGGGIIQAGGTNSGGLVLGRRGPFSNVNPGSYTLSNGVITTSSIRVQGGGSFNQQGGIHTVTGTLNLVGDQIGLGSFALGGYSQEGGLLQSDNLSLQAGVFSQSGGTNQVAGEVTLLTPSYFNLDGGTLLASNTSLQISYFGGGFYQRGGTHIVADTLRVEGQTFLAPLGYQFSGGALIVSNIVISSRGLFQHLGGTITQSGFLSLDSGTWSAKTNYQQLGQLKLWSASTGNDTIILPAGGSVLQFAASAGQNWSFDSTLTIENWNGSVNGGGQHRILFGGNSGGLTPSQLGQIRFHNPVGAGGMYPATILSTGEIVPARFVASQRTPSGLSIRWSSGTLQSSTNVAGPYEDVGGATSPYNASFTGSARFFRTR